MVNKVPYVGCTPTSSPQLELSSISLKPFPMQAALLPASRIQSLVPIPL